MRANAVPMENPKNPSLLARKKAREAYPPSRLKESSMLHAQRSEDDFLSCVIVLEKVHAQL